MASERDWLLALKPLLAPAMPASLALLVDAPSHDEWQWADRLSAAHVVACTNARPPSRGWLLRLPSTRPCAVLLEAAGALRPGDPVLRAARALCRAAWRLREPLPLGPLRSDAQQAMHDLRNGLNSIVMTSAVLAAAPAPASLTAFVEDLQAAGRRSLRALEDLGDCLPRS